MNISKEHLFAGRERATFLFGDPVVRQAVLSFMDEIERSSPVTRKTIPQHAMAGAGLHPVLFLTTNDEIDRRSLRAPEVFLDQRVLSAVRRHLFLSLEQALQLLGVMYEGLTPCTLTSHQLSNGTKVIASFRNGERVSEITVGTVPFALGMTAA